MSYDQARVLDLEAAQTQSRRVLRVLAEVHGPIGAAIPGLRKLVQSVTVRGHGDPQPDFDGMAELWFDDWEALGRARLSAEWHASTADEANFIDSTRTAYFVTEERQIL